VTSFPNTRDRPETACAPAGFAPSVGGARARDPLGTALALLYVLLWASAYVPSKIASLATDPLWFLAVRFLLAGALLAGLAVASGQAFPRSLRGWLVAAGLGLLANDLYLGLTYLALRHHLSSGMGAIVASLNPLVLALVAPALLAERLTPLKGFGLALGFGGVVALVQARSGTGTAAPFDVMLAFGGVCASVASTILYKRAGVGQSLIAINAVQLLVAGAAMIPVAALSAGVPRVTITWALVASLGYLVIVISCGASLLWFWLLSHGEASRVSAYYYLTPAFGLALSALLLHEGVGFGDLPGLAAIAGGIALVQRS
jgi:drug/metabolite transporter (DMT)-like permease